MRQVRGEKRAAKFAKDEFRLNPHYYAKIEDNDADDAPYDTVYHPRPMSYASATHFPVVPQGYTPSAPCFPFPEPHEKEVDEKEMNEKDTIHTV